jgi:hypothetical protein
MRKLIIALIVVGLLGGGAYAFYRWQKYYKEPVPAAIEIDKVTQVTPEEKQDSDDTQTSTPPETETPPPPSLNLKLAFYSQAPYGNWGYPWQEACEEASVLLVANAYFKHDWTKEQFNNEILKLVDWEKKRFGSYEHTNVDQTAEMLKDYLGLESKIHEDPSFEDVQKALAKGHLVVMTLAGKQLKNPFYTNGGPIYHALVVKGYKEGEKVITHDVGTRRGEDYVYSWERLQGALHDYAEPISNGPKRMIEVLPPESSEISPSNE